MAEPARKISYEEQLAEDISRFVYDPLGHVLYSYDWDFDAGEGPDDWQVEVLVGIGDRMREAAAASFEDAEKNEAAAASVKKAVASGHGIGKSALIAWIIRWFMDTRPHPQVVVTANTAKQLETKTWRELSKWNKRAITGHWYTWTATKFYRKDSPETWAAYAIPWSKDKSEAFAGTHEEHVLVLFDEASLIDAVIWEVTEGAMTTPGALWLAFGNPTKNSGKFRECFGKAKHRWHPMHVDSRTAKMTNKAQIKEWADDYGEDSDFFRVRVKGQFPRASVLQLIPTDLVESASGKHLSPEIYRHAPVVLGCDVAWEGDDQFVIFKRQGLATWLLGKWRELEFSTATFANLIAQYEDQHKADAVFVDVVGVGAGVVDNLRQMGRSPIPINSGRNATNSDKYENLRIEMWDKTKSWLEDGGAIPVDQGLIDGLTAPEFGYTGKRNRIILEKKKDMKSRGLASPDEADALALTFARPVVRRQDLQRLPGQRRRAQTDYDVLGG